MKDAVPLGEVCELIYGESLKEANRRDGKVPVYGSNGVVGWHNQALTRAPVIVVGRKGSIGEVNFSEVPCFPIDTTYYIDTTKQPCDLRWLYFTLLKLDLTRFNKAAAIPGLNRDDAYRQQIPFPAIAEQQRMAELLARADRLRRLRMFALEISNTVVSACFREMFGSPLSMAKRFAVTELGQIAKFIDYRGIAPNKVEHGVRLVTARNVKRGFFEINPQEFIPSDEYESWMRRGMPKHGDVLFTTEGHTLGSAAKLPPFEKVALAQRLIALQPSEGVTSDYLLQLVLSGWFQAEVVKRSTGSAARGISSRQLGEIPIPLPPLSLQHKFASLAANHERLRTFHSEGLRQAEHLFQTLLQRAFTSGL